MGRVLGMDPLFLSATVTLTLLLPNNVQEVL
jgi:hypothetical protein